MAEYGIIIDTETTGLDGNLPNEELLEIGVGVVRFDGGIRLVDSMTSLVKHTKGREQCAPLVQEMHDKSGLWADLELIDHVNGLPDVTEVDMLMRDWLDNLEGRYAIRSGTQPMMGSSVQFDRAFVRCWLPETFRWFHYRNIDTSSLKEACRRWNPAVYETLPPKNEFHRVRPDMQDTLEEFRHYYKNFLITTL